MRYYKSSLVTLTLKLDPCGWVCVCECRSVCLLSVNVHLSACMLPPCPLPARGLQAPFSSHMRLGVGRRSHGGFVTRPFTLPFFEFLHFGFSIFRFAHFDISDLSSGSLRIYFLQLHPELSQAFSHRRCFFQFLNFQFSYFIFPSPSMFYEAQ